LGASSGDENRAHGLSATSCRFALAGAEPDVISNAIGFAKFFSRSHDAVIRVYDDAGNVIETHEQRRVSKTDGRLNLLLWRIDRDFRYA
jgi:hypothetical protein